MSRTIDSISALWDYLRLKQLPGQERTKITALNPTSSYTQRNRSSVEMSNEKPGGGQTGAPTSSFQRNNLKVTPLFRSRGTRP